MKKIQIIQNLLILSLVISWLASSCNLKVADATPTQSPELMQTLAVMTFSAGLTQTEMARPTDTPTSTVTPSPTSTATLAVTKTSGAPLGSGGRIQPTASCYSMAFVADVTIPDNTSMKPGQTFTKTWRVRNNGTCAWDAGFKFAFTGGNSLGGTTLTLKKAVRPGTETELSVDMTAPDTSGSYQSNWRMVNASNANFGDEVFVLIVVSGNAVSTSTITSTGVSATATVTSTATATGTPTNTPEP